MSSYTCSLCPRSKHVAKRSRQEKATLRWRSATRTAHAASTEIGKRPKLASLRQRTLLYPISALATCRHLTGFHCNGNSHFKSNGNGNGNGNGNCRYAERQGQPQRPPPWLYAPLHSQVNQLDPLPVETRIIIGESRHDLGLG